ncbi:hypothetical protein ADK60_37605 [Streptomyces sp. XY431]|uniref:hypothetical protein n=1 Tax=Streptomyces sp. XY431 TaxID=1415562 RepID=UPI0006AEBBA8|nr:hypothetical protein [Streptomyces sp. XY431]KOV10684.1 hypothetical protein ADK60_37605 [Streptomyces sp. XY431]
MALISVLTACGGGGAPSATAAASGPSGPSSSTPTGENRSVSRGFEPVPQAALDAYLADLRAADPALAANDVDAWTEGVHLCYYSFAGQSQEELVASANRAFGTERGASVLAAARKHLCGVQGVRDEWELYRPRSS